MKEKLKWISALMVVLSLGACAQTNINSPCPNFGKYCPQTPVNVWDYNKA